MGGGWTAAARYREEVDGNLIALDQVLRSRIESHLAGFERQPWSDPKLRRAAVAVTLVDDAEGEACFVLTRRASRLKDHAGQWALPGGSLDAGEGAREAALRELSEEVGLEIGGDGILGLLDDYPTRSGFSITPVVVWAAPGATLEANPDEVAEVYRVPLRDLEAPEVPQLRTIPESDRPVISVPLLGSQIHAPTAAILYQLREVALRGLNTRVSHYEQPVFAWR